MPESKTKLGLRLPTDPRWANLAEMDIGAILTDHAYCEQKAASACISLIQLFPTHEKLVSEVAPIVSEEWEHFRMVYDEIKKRGFQLGRQRKDEYVIAILAFQRKGGSPDIRIMDKLLTNALIEARSCERFRMLSLHLSDPELRAFYHQFLVSEAGHYKCFLNLAKHYCGQKETEERWNEMLIKEAEIMRTLLPNGRRMH
jgi:tRNA-(ms[2]io[6]A)-hydroxylase